MPEDPERSIEEARLLREQGIIVVAIGIGEEMQLPMLQEFATAPELAMNTTDYFELDLIRPEIAMRSCRRINPELKMPACNVGADILFILDHSISLANSYHTTGIQFIEDFARKFIVSDKHFHARVAMMLFSNAIDDKFCFHEFKSNVELSQAIN